MPKAGEFLKTEEARSAQQTLSPRDFLNKQYIYRYEDVVEVLDISSRFDRFAFLNALNKLYWSFIIPRQYTHPLYGLEEEEQKQFAELATCLVEKDEKKGFLLLQEIAHLLHEKGVLRTEKTQLPMGHEFMQDLEVV
jgi:hypothetical protein